MESNTNLTSSYLLQKSARTDFPISPRLLIGVKSGFMDIDRRTRLWRKRIKYYHFFGTPISLFLWQKKSKDWSNERTHDIYFPVFFFEARQALRLIRIAQFTCSTGILGLFEEIYSNYGRNQW